jgi:hypothetical protein
MGDGVVYHVGFHDRIEEYAADHHETGHRYRNWYNSPRGQCPEHDISPFALLVQKQA